MIREINESSISRVIQHVMTDGREFAIISAYRGINSSNGWNMDEGKEYISYDEVDELDAKQHESLKKDLRKYGYTELGSGYKNVDEQSFFITRITKEEAMVLGKKYNQQSILWKDDNFFGIITTINYYDRVNKKNWNIGDVQMTFKRKVMNDIITFDPEVLQYAYSQLKKGTHNHRNKQFAFKTESLKIFEKQYLGRADVLRRKEFYEYQEILVESSLSKVWRHNEKHDCGAMTAFRRRDLEGNTLSKAEKLERNKILTAKLMSMGYSITRLNGVYPEGGEIIKEISYFVVDIHDEGNLKADLKKLGEEFEQDSVLFIPHGAINNDAQAYLIGTNHDPDNFLSYGQEMLFDYGKLGYTSPIYTSYVNGRPFMFGTVDKKLETPQTGYGVWCLQEYAKKNLSEV